MAKYDYIPVSYNIYYEVVRWGQFDKGGRMTQVYFSTLNEATKDYNKKLRTGGYRGLYLYEVVKGREPMGKVLRHDKGPDFSTFDAKVKDGYEILTANPKTNQAGLPGLRY